MKFIFLRSILILGLLSGACSSEPDVTPTDDVGAAIDVAVYAELAASEHTRAQHFKPARVLFVLRATSFSRPPGLVFRPLRPLLLIPQHAIAFGLCAGKLLDNKLLVFASQYRN